eukprot:TRINITY_DN540_c0_g1_i1.p1 TRINITY_DN540_c0_g1~~TRINITY_DN540_c0_g1_i1.p1  ORF type:complete len:311 (-),score=43.16 TRINITY_DN540_c0_g1_i1:66-947(-)
MGGVSLALSPLAALATSGVLAGGFVGSLYVWRQSTSLSRDHPTQIKRRLISIVVWCAIAPLIFAYWSVPDEKGLPLYVLLGFNTEGLLYALFLPLLLTMSLFLGPLYMNYLTSRTVRDYISDSLDERHRLIQLRNIIAGPFAEEWVFRACICPLLFAGGFSVPATVLGSPVLFGVAHLHHLVDHVKSRGMSLRDGCLVVGFQLFYTTVFGAYASFLFVRTGHAIAPMLVHSFCNIMEFPDLSWLFNREHPHRKEIGIAFVVGIILFAFLLFPMTTPSLYGSWFYKSLLVAPYA